jgi:hypothetical protein
MMALMLMLNLTQRNKKPFQLVTEKVQDDETTLLLFDEGTVRNVPWSIFFSLLSNQA